MFIVVASPSGGVGKSSISSNLAYQLAQAGYAIGLVDGDLKSPGIHLQFGLDSKDFKYTMTEVILGKVNNTNLAAHDLTKKVGIKGQGRLVLLPARMTVAAISEIHLSHHADNLLIETLNGVLDKLNLDMLIIDSHPGQEKESLLVLSVAHSAIMVIKPDERDIQGVNISLTMARKLGLVGDNKIALVVNRIPQSFNVKQVTSEINRYVNLPIVVALMDDPDTLPTMQGKGLMALSYPNSSFIKELNKLTTYIINDFEERINAD